MGVVFYKKIQILPFLALNISKSGISWSIGRPGANVNIGTDGVHISTGVPGSGVGYRKRFGMVRLAPVWFWGVSLGILAAALLWRWYTGQGLPPVITKAISALMSYV